MNPSLTPLPDAVVVSDDCEVIALFDLNGTLVQGSLTYRRAVRDQWIADDLLALPRALALRAACDGGAFPVTAFTRRLVCIDGVEHVLQPRWVDAEVTGDQPLIALTIARCAGHRAAAAPSGSAPRVRRHCRLRRPHAALVRRGRRAADHRRRGVQHG